MAGVARFLVLIHFLVYFSHVSSELTNLIDEDVLTTQAFMFWPNATVPFYIDTNHFDEEQVTTLMSALSLFAFKTCLKFAPVLALPQESDHVLQFENPTGLRKCEINMEPRNLGEQRRLVLGYDCLHSPEIYMIIMKELGFPFEHNRAVRDLYIDVQTENVEPGYLDLFVKDLRLPVELRSISYDRNSVMHFGEREYSKNGHKTIIFKDRNFRQERYGLSPIDLRKIEIVYGPECKKRDRQEKVELCQNYPGVARRKREVTTVRSLRVNPDITPPPEIDNKDRVIEPETNNNGSVKGYTDKLVEDLDIVKEVEDLISQVHKTAGVALLKARERYCNGSKTILRTEPEMEKPSDHNILGIINEVASYSKELIDKAMANFTEFCAASKSIDDYQRNSCPFYDSAKCIHVRYKSTKTGRVKWSTQHRPPIVQSTKHYGVEPKNIFKDMYHSLHVRSGNGTSSETVDAANNQTKEDTKSTPESKSPLRANTNKIFKNAGHIYAPKYRASDTKTNAETENKEVKPGESRKKREVAGEQPTASTESPKKVINESTTKFEPKPTFYKSSGNGSKVLKRRFQGKINRARKSKVPEEKEVAWEESEVENEEKGDAEATTKAKVLEPKEIASTEAKVTVPSADEVPTSLPMQVEPKFIEPGSLVKKKLISTHRQKAAQVSTAHKPKKNKTRVVQGNSHKLPLTISIKEKNAEVKNVHDISYKSSSKQRKNKASKRKKEKNEPRAAPVKLPRTVELTKKNAEFYNERKWPDNTVRYLIRDTGDFDMEDCRARLAEVNDILRQKTCVVLEEITDAQTDLFEDYLVLDNSPDFVTGRVGGRQAFGVVELLKGGQHRQHAAMMVMAMLGFYFEVARHDRDQFIRVHMRHVRPDKLHHFEKIREDATFKLPYDYKSATHPAWQFWRHLGKQGISTVATFKELDPDGAIMKILGQNDELLSSYDIIKINSVYGTECFEPKDAEVAEPAPDDEADVNVQEDAFGQSNEPPEETLIVRAKAKDAEPKETEDEEELISLENVLLQEEVDELDEKEEEIEQE